MHHPICSRTQSKWLLGHLMTLGIQGRCPRQGTRISQLRSFDCINSCLLMNFTTEQGLVIPHIWPCWEQNPGAVIWETHALRWASFFLGGTMATDSAMLPLEQGNSCKCNSLLLCATHSPEAGPQRTAAYTRWQLIFQLTRARSVRPF